MARPALRIGVTTKDQKALRKLLSGGVQQVRVVLRAVALLQLAKGVSAPRVSAVVPLTPQAIRKVGHRYQQGGLERALYEKQRPGAGDGQLEYPSPQVPDGFIWRGGRRRNLGPIHGSLHPHPWKLAQSGRNRNRNILAAMPRHQKNSRPEDSTSRKPRLESSDESR